MSKNRLLGPWSTEQPASRTWAEPPRPQHPARDALNTWKQRIERAAGDHPLPSLAVALALGVFVGWLIKRK